MIPRTVRMAAEVAAQFTALELDLYGNITINGYATTGPNTTGKLGWAWADNPLAPATPLPTVTSVRPALKGWTNNYTEYFTRLPFNPYIQIPGNPTNFYYNVHSFTPLTGSILVLGGNGTWLTPGSGYTPGTYLGQPLTGGSGAGATADIVVAPDLVLGGYVQSVTLVNPGSGYTVGDALSAALPLGSGFTVTVSSIAPVLGTGSNPRWNQVPRRFYQNQVAPFVPPTPNQKAIQYTFMHPFNDAASEPPIDHL